MNDSYTKQKIKETAFCLKRLSTEHGFELSIAQAHEITVSFVGNYSSKAAFGKDEFVLDSDDPDLFKFEGGTRRIANRIESLCIEKTIPVSFISSAAHLISEMLTPICSDCRCNSFTRPINQEHDTQYQEQLWVCDRCIAESDLYGYCRFCGEEHLFRFSDLNKYNECPEHTGECLPSDEDDASDRESYLEYWQNH